MSTLEDYFAFAKNNPTLFVNPHGAGFEILLNEAEIRKAESQMEQRLKAKGLPVEWAQVGIAFSGSVHYDPS